MTNNENVSVPPVTKRRRRNTSIKNNVDVNVVVRSTIAVAVKTIEKKRKIKIRRNAIDHKKKNINAIVPDKGREIDAIDCIAISIPRVSPLIIFIVVIWRAAWCVPRSVWTPHVERQ